MIEVREIMELLPHRYPFLLVDRIVELESEKTARGIKNVTIGEHFFQGHFPGHPIMPGVLIIEAMAQVGGILAFKSTGLNNRLVYFMAIDKARFRRPVVPGDTLDIRVDVVKHRSEIWVLKGTASVGDAVCAEAELMAKVVEK